MHLKVDLICVMSSTHFLTLKYLAMLYVGQCDLWNSPEVMWHRIIIERGQIFGAIHLKTPNFEVDILMDMTIARNIIGWTEEGKKEKQKKNCAVVRVKKVNTYKNLSYNLPAQSLSNKWIDYLSFMKRILCRVMVKWRLDTNPMQRT